MPVSCAEPCYDCSRPNQAAGAAGSIITPPRVERLDWNNIGGLIAIQAGARLRLINLHLENFAQDWSSEDLATASPVYIAYRNVGSGPGIAPTISMAPGAVVSVPSLTGPAFLRFSLPTAGSHCVALQTVL